MGVRSRKSKEWGDLQPSGAQGLCDWRWQEGTELIGRTALMLKRGAVTRLQLAVGVGSLWMALKTRLCMLGAAVPPWEEHFRKTNLVTTYKIFWREKDHRSKKGERGKLTMTRGCVLITMPLCGGVKQVEGVSASHCEDGEEQSALSYYLICFKLQYLP